MLVVADTGPLRYLVEVNAIAVLPRLYGRIMTTPQVIQELCLPHFPHVVRTWAGCPPAWLEVIGPEVIRFADHLHEGEASALSLACEQTAELVLIDDRDGTHVALENGFQTLGTLGILREAGAREYLDFNTALGALLHTRFRYTPELIGDARRQYEALCRDLHERPARPNPPDQPPR